MVSVKFGALWPCHGINGNYAIITYHFGGSSAYLFDDSLKYEINKIITIKYPLPALFLAWLVLFAVAHY